MLRGVFLRGGSVLVGVVGYCETRENGKEGVFARREERVLKGWEKEQERR